MSIIRVRSNLIINFCFALKLLCALHKSTWNLKKQDNSDQNNWSQSNCVFCKIIIIKIFFVCLLNKINKLSIIYSKKKTRVTLVSTYLFIFLVVLIVVISFKCQFCAAMFAFEAARMKKRKIFEGSDAIHLIHYLLAPETGGLVKIRSIHFFSFTILTLLHCLIYFLMFYL